MSDWIDRLANREKEELARKSRVGAANDLVFDSLWKALENRVHRYNKGHPRTDRWSPDAVSASWEQKNSTLISGSIKKNTKPNASLVLEFPINSGQMQFRIATEVGTDSGTIEIDIQKSTGVSFAVGSESFSSETLADTLLRRLLDPLSVIQIAAAARLAKTDASVAALRAIGKQTAASELHEANLDLSKTPPDLTGSIQHSLAALECIAREYCGDHSTFGKLLERYPELFPKPLDKGIEKIWGFASEMGRHLQEGRTPDPHEAELLVGLAAACCIYLVRKVQDSPA